MASKLEGSRELGVREIIGIEKRRQCAVSNLFGVEPQHLKGREKKP